MQGMVQGDLFIVERSGRIRVMKNGTLLATPFLDIQSIVKSTSGEQGLLGLAFHPPMKAMENSMLCTRRPAAGIQTAPS